jgi:hypothetical protein
MMETHFSLTAEYRSREQKYSLTRSASATLDKLIKVGGKVGVDFEFGDKSGTDVGEKDVHH